MEFSVGKLKLSLDGADQLFILLLLVFSFVDYELVSQFRQLPSPVYGGDYYYHLGMMNHIDRGGSIFSNSQLLNETPWAPFFYQLLVVFFSRLTGIGLMFANIYSSFFFLAASMLIVYLFSQKVLGDKLMSLIPVMFFAYGFPIFKYREAAFYVIAPLFLYSLLLAFEKRTYRHHLFAGVCYGIMGVTHTVGFMVMTVFSGVALIYMYAFRFFDVEVVDGVRIKASVRWAEARKYLAESWKMTAVFLVVGILLAQLYWYAPIFKFHLQTPNPISEYDQADVSTMNGDYTWGVVRSFFFDFDFSSPLLVFSSLTTLLMDVGILWLLFKKKREFSHTYLLLMVVAHIIVVLHYVFSLPLLGREFFSRLSGPFLYVTMDRLLLCFGLIAAMDFLRLREQRRWITVFCIFIVLVCTLQTSQQSWAVNEAYLSGRSELPKYMLEVSAWMKSNTGVDDVFISTNEISFMLNGLSGNKVVNSRRAHSGMFVDVDRRWADSAVILYGNNSRLRSELIKKYEVKYLYWQPDWISLDYQVYEDGRVSWFDPFLIRDIGGYDAYLADNGVAYNKLRTWLDPTNRFKEEIRTFDVLMVVPSRWDSEKPWNPSLDSNLTLVKEFTQDGYVMARIYRVS